MKGINAAVAMSGVLDTKVVKDPRPLPRHKARSIRIPCLGRLILTKDPGQAAYLASDYFQSNLSGVHRDGDGAIIDTYDWGSGLVTNIGVFSMCLDWAWLWTGGVGTGPSTLGAQNWHAWGTGATAPAATDYKMQTLAAPTTTSAVAGVQSLVAPTTFVGPTSPIYKNVATINAGSSITVAEWGLHSLQALTSAVGSPLTAVSATTWTDTGSAQTASSATVRGLQQTVIQTATTASIGLNLSNTTHVATLAASVTPTGWYTQATQAAGTTPGGTEVFAILPVMWDHKPLSVAVNSGDSIQFTYSLSVNSGG